MSDPAQSLPVSLDPEADESRVYLGPFKSPEKKYLPVTRPITPSPLRRSPRLSSPIPGRTAAEDEDENPDEDGEEDLSCSRSGTPDNDGWQADEPSSVLATRIARAHDNPSPPPASPIQDLDSAPPTPPIYPTRPIPFIIPDSPSPRFRGGSPFVPRPSKSPSNPQRDLISFDSFSASAGSLPTLPIASTSFIPPETHNPSVDELLTSWSPSARDIPSASVSPPASEAEGGDSKGKARAGDETTPEAAEEQAVANALIMMDDAPPSPPSLQRDTIMVDSQPADVEASWTPLRRSTRPRRSTTPHLVPLPSSDDESPTGKNLTPLTKKRRKGTDRSPLVPSEPTEGQSDLDVPMSEEGWEMKKRREKEERKQAKANAAPQTLLQRQLGSLSPGSANLLTQLIPPSRPSPVREQEEPQPAFSFSVFSANPVQTTPVPMSSPIRASPERRAKPRSPNRIQFQAPSLDDPNRTPARRIPVEQAVARGQISPQKAAQLRANNVDARAGAVSRTPVFHIPTQDTPARRVNINVVPPSTGQSKWQGMRFGSPTRGRLMERSGSAEPRPPWNASGPAPGPSDLRASASKSRTSPSRSSPSRSTSVPIKQGKLPFPLTPSGSDRPASIPELDDKPLSSDADAPVPPASPVLGVIKVPRSSLKQPTSRIPRIGTKPYARPAAAAKSTADKNSKAPAASTRKAATAREPPSRTIKVAQVGNGSSSDGTTTVEAGPSSLKRKRIPSPQFQRPVVLIRQLPPQSSPKSAAPKPTPGQAPSPAKRPASPVKRPPVAKFRMVDLHTRPTDPEPSPPEPEPVSFDVLPSPPVSSPVIPSEELASDPGPHPVSSPLLDVSEPLSAVRRTTRLRKSVFPASEAPPQPLPTRRKVSNQQPPGGSGVFAGMTAVALKALTSSNTTKNQKYLAAKLETEVIRKEGARPESPAVKIRTIAQREQDEKGLRRKQRAARRAGRSDDGFSENEGTSDADESPMDTDMDSSPVRRHRRGPGDEEEYETPKVNGAKRTRTDSMSDDEQAEKKRVKWHRGLSTTVFLDEVEPRPNARPKENVVKKGCLAPTAKAIQLDSLGNLPNAESPLKDLVEENVVVKKFVYDNDEPVVPVTVVKNTRSKAKKKS